MWAVAGIASYAGYRLLQWVGSAPVTPNPWDDEVEKQLHEPEATPLCHKCFTPQPRNQWFCEHCGSAVGEFNNTMPYVYLFSEGEVLRHGISGNVSQRPLIIVGYLLFSLSCYSIFAPVYWYLFFQNLRRTKVENPGRALPGEI